MTNLFFDDYRIVSRDNVIREQGCPTLIPESIMFPKENECAVFSDVAVVYNPAKDIYTMYGMRYRNENDNWKIYCIAQN